MQILIIIYSIIFGVYQIEKTRDPVLYYDFNTPPQTSKTTAGSKRGPIPFLYTLALDSNDNYYHIITGCNTLNIKSGTILLQSNGSSSGRNTT